MWGRLALVCALLAGCDRVFGLGDPYQDAPSGSGVSDAPSDSPHAPPLEAMAPDAPASGPLLHFSFDQGTIDDAGHSITACSGLDCTISTTGAKVGMGALRLASSDCLKFTISGATSTFSLALWANPTTSNEQTMLSRAVDSTPSMNDAWRLHGSGSQSGFEIFDSGAATDLPIAAALAANVWQHYAITYDGSVVRTYYNGQPTTSTVASGIQGSTATAAVLGCDSGETTGFFTGMIDDVYIYDRALAPSEVTVLYEAQ